MTQRIESRRFPYLLLRIWLDGLELRLEALIDTGFDGDLALPPELVEGASPEAFEVYLARTAPEPLCTGAAFSCA